MFKLCFLAAALLISSPGFSQNRQNRHFHVEGFSVKTDVLPLFNSAISGSLKSWAVSGEIYFNNEYSVSADVGAESSDQDDVKWSERRLGSHLRWYFMQDDCNCSAFFGGIYFSNVRKSQTVDEQYPRNNIVKPVNYNKSSFEGGLCGGYQALFSGHFVIDPAVQLGVEFYSGIQSTESMNDLSDPPEKGLLLVKIMLAIGYRF